MEKIRATQLAGLEKFAGVVFEGAQGKYCLDEYSYFDDTSLFSTASFVTGAAGVLAAGVEQSLFTVPVGGQGQGFPAATPMTLADTNLERGADGGKFPANQAYVAVAGGFEVYLMDTAIPGVIPVENDTDLHQILSSFIWTWNVGGDASPRLQYEPILNWPIGAGISGIGASSGFVVAGGAALVQWFVAPSNGGPTSTMRKFTFPLFFPPNVAVDCRVRCLKPLNLIGPVGAAGATTRIQIAMHLRGYKLSRLV